MRCKPDSCRDPSRETWSPSTLAATVPVTSDITSTDPGTLAAAVLATLPATEGAGAFDSDTPAAAPPCRRAGPSRGSSALPMAPTDGSPAAGVCASGVSKSGARAGGEGSCSEGTMAADTPALAPAPPVAPPPALASPDTRTSASAAPTTDIVEMSGVRSSKSTKHRPGGQ